MEIDILLIDEDKDFLTILDQGLRQYSKKFNVITAENGVKALDALRTIMVDVVVTDLKMPVMDGYELLRDLQQLRWAHQHIRVIIVSAKNSKLEWINQ